MNKTIKLILVIIFILSIPLAVIKFIYPMISIDSNKFSEEYAKIIGGAILGIITLIVFRITNKYFEKEDTIRKLFYLIDNYIIDVNEICNKRIDINNKVRFEEYFSNKKVSLKFKENEIVCEIDKCAYLNKIDSKESVKLKNLRRIFDNLQDVNIKTIDQQVNDIMKLKKYYEED